MPITNSLSPALGKPIHPIPATDLVRTEDDFIEGDFKVVDDDDDADNVNDLPELPEGREHRSAQRSVAQRRKTRNSYRSVFKIMADKIMKRELKAARAALKRSETDASINTFANWVEEYYPQHERQIIRDSRARFMALATAIFADVGEELDGEGTLDARAENFVNKYSGGFARRHINSSKGQLRKLLREEDNVFETIGTRLTQWGDTRAGKIVQREVVQAAEAFTKQAMRANGVTKIVWVTVGENCDLCEEMEGRTVEITQTFAKPGDKVDPDTDTSQLNVTQVVGHPPLHEGCDCSTAAG